MGAFLGKLCRGKIQRNVAQSRGEEREAVPEGRTPALKDRRSDQQKGCSEDDRGGAVFRIRACKESENAEQEPFPRARRAASVDEFGDKGLQEQQPEDAGPEVIAGAVKPQVDLTEGGLEDPDGAKGCRDQQRVHGVPFFDSCAADPVQQKDLQGEETGVDEVEDPLREHLKDLHQEVGNETSVHLDGMGCHGGENLKNTGDPLLCLETEMVRKVVRELGREKVAQQQKKENAEIHPCGRISGPFE